MGGLLHGPWQHPWPWMCIAPRTSPQVVALGPAPTRAEPQDRSEIRREVSRRVTMTRICARVTGVTPIASRENRISLA